MMTINRVVTIDIILERRKKLVVLSTVTSTAKRQRDDVQLWTSVLGNQSVEMCVKLVTEASRSALALN